MAKEDDLMKLKETDIIPDLSRKYGELDEDQKKARKAREAAKAAANYVEDPELENIMKRFKGVTKDSEILKSNDDILEGMKKAAREYVNDFDDSKSYDVKRFKESDIPNYDIEKLKNPGMDLKSIPDEPKKTVNRLDLLNDIKAKFDKGPSSLESMSEEKAMSKLKQPESMKKILAQMEMDELGRASREALPEKTIQKQGLLKSMPKLAKVLGKAGKIGGGLALGLAGEILLPEELGDPSSIIENPDASPEERKAAMEAMRAETKGEMLIKKLEEDRMKRAEMLMKKYGKR